MKTRLMEGRKAASTTGQGGAGGGGVRRGRCSGGGVGGRGGRRPGKRWKSEVEGLTKRVSSVRKTSELLIPQRFKSSVKLTLGSPKSTSFISTVD